MDGTQDAYGIYPKILGFGNAILIGFNVKPNREAKKLAEEQKVDVDKDCFVKP